MAEQSFADSFGSVFANLGQKYGQDLAAALKIPNSEPAGNAQTATAGNTAAAANAPKESNNTMMYVVLAVAVVAVGIVIWKS